MTSKAFHKNKSALLKSARNDSRKGGKLECNWTGPYVISNCLAKGLYKLVKNGKELKRSYNGVRLKKYAKPSTVNDAAASGSKNTVNPKVWLPEVGLTMEDKETIQGNSKLDDKVINAAQTVLKQHFPGISGWQDTILSQTSFEPIPVDSVQIHHDPKRDHWVCSSSVHGNIQVFDSLFETLSTSMQIQLAECYRFAIKFDTLEIEVPCVQRQSGGIDCGLFAIAFAYELAAGNEHSIQSKRFEQHRMRDHLIRCLENGEFGPFPGQNNNKRKREEPNIFEIELFCNCLMPEVSDDMILCDLCDHWFHFRCVNVKSMDENEQWLCPECTPPAS